MSSATLTHRSTALPVGVYKVGRTFPARDKDGAPRTVLSDISLDIAAGEIIALIGASGCGKSTLLRQICGLDTPTTGVITIGDRPVAGIDPSCAVGFQEPRLLPWRTIGENVTLGLPDGVNKYDGHARVQQLLDLVGLAACIDQRPREISGGMAQRASLARALARNPAVLVLDEPFGALDALTRLHMQDLLLDIHQAEPTTIVLVTHDVDEALYLADRIVLLGKDAGADERDPASIQQLVAVPGRRPRDRSAANLSALRTELLAGLGVKQHH